MQKCEHKLKHLLDTIPVKLEKSVTIIKNKLTKTLAHHKKAGITLKITQVKHKAKPNKLIQAAVKKSEQALAGTSIVVASMKEELARLQAHLVTCKDMKKILNTPHKLSVKKTKVKKQFQNSQRK